MDTVFAVVAAEGVVVCLESVDGCVEGFADGIGLGEDEVLGRG